MNSFIHIEGSRLSFSRSFLRMNKGLADYQCIPSALNNWEKLGILEMGRLGRVLRSDDDQTCLNIIVS